MHSIEIQVSLKYDAWQDDLNKALETERVVRTDPEGVFIKKIGVLEEGTEGGHPAILLQVDTGEELIIAQTTLRLFLMAVKSIMDAYPVYVRETFSL